MQEITDSGLPEGKTVRGNGQTSSGKTLFAMVCIFLIPLFFTSAYSQPSEVVEGNDITTPFLLFLGNKTLPPMIYLKNDKPIGIVVDLAEALKERMTSPVKIKYMHWTQAQKLMIEGKADALLQINSTEERKKIYDFSDFLLESEFSIFTSFDREGVYDVTSLRGLKVGVEGNGLPINILKKYPLIKTVVVPDIMRGFHLLADGAIDAVVVDRWVGAFVLAENNITGVKISGEAIEKSNSAIAVKKGNTKLLAEINKALAEIKGDGTYTEILAKWQSKEIVFQTKDQYFKQKIILATLLCVVIITIIWSIFLLNEIKKRKQVEEALQESEARFRSLSDAAFEGILISEKGRIIEVNNTMSEIFGYSTTELISMSATDLSAPEMREKIIEKMMSGYEKPYEGNGLRKDGSIFPAEIHTKAFSYKGRNLSVTAIRDITERKQAEEEHFNRVKLQAVLETAGAACHELSQPMQTISGYSELLSMGISEKDPLYEKVRKIKEQIDRMGKITGKLMGITRYETKVYTGEKKIIDLDHVIERRKYKRFIPYSQAFVILKSDSRKQHQIIDISMKGLAFRCNKIQDQLYKSNDLSINMTDGNFSLDHIPCKTISDLTIAVDSPPGSVSIKRCCVQFGDLNQNQRGQLEYYINNHTSAG